MLKMIDCDGSDGMIVICRRVKCFIHPTFHNLNKYVSFYKTLLKTYTKTVCEKLFKKWILRFLSMLSNFSA